MLEIIIDNRDGQLWDMSGIVSSLIYKTSLIGKPSSVEFTFIKGGLYEVKEFKYNNGDIVRIRKDDVNVFYGYIFVIDSGRDEEVKITAYDQIRYLLANDSYKFLNAKVGDIIQQIANDFQLKTGSIADTAYNIPKLLEEDSKLLDIICKALDLTLISTKQIYVLYDNFGELTLKNAVDMTLDFYVGDVSLAFDYKQKRSIDQDAYNFVKLVRPNKDTGMGDVYIYKDTNSIKNWGKLQLYQKVDEGMNPAQINEAAANLLKLKNREQISFQLPCIGDIRVRAGCYIPVVIEELGLNQPFLIRECSHEFDGDEHIMTLDLIDVRRIRGA